MPRIIAAYPGCGKTTFAANHSDIAIDLEYSIYSNIRDEYGRKVFDSNNNPIINFAYPYNYITDIERAMNYGYEYIFVSTHPSVLKALIEYGFSFTVVVPKHVWTIRFIQRDDDVRFITQQRTKGEAWLEEIRANRNNFDGYIELEDNEYIGSILE